LKHREGGRQPPAGVGHFAPLTAALAVLVVRVGRGYAESMSFTRITVRPDQMGGVPCVRGLRIPVAVVVGMVADGMDEYEIIAAYPDLEVEDVREAIRYAAEAVRERELPLLASE
jgi:uncharacterized protein (DUF433 family)